MDWPEIARALDTVATKFLEYTDLAMQAKQAAAAYHELASENLRLAGEVRAQAEALQQVEAHAKVVLIDLARYQARVETEIATAKEQLANDLAAQRAAFQREAAAAAAHAASDLATIADAKRIHEQDAEALGATVLALRREVAELERARDTLRTTLGVAAR